MADTDRELLELAAKAAGMHPDHWCWNGYGMRELAVHGVPHCGFQGEIWNPLTDDGDALRLAVKLGISITPYPIYSEEARHSVIAKQRRRSDTLREVNPTEVLVLYGKDPAAAWRLAIVMCAAKIEGAA